MLEPSLTLRSAGSSVLEGMPQRPTLGEGRCLIDAELVTEMSYGSAVAIGLDQARDLLVIKPSLKANAPGRHEVVPAQPLGEC